MTPETLPGAVCHSKHPSLQSHKQLTCTNRRPIPCAQDNQSSRYPIRRRNRQATPPSHSAPSNAKHRIIKTQTRIPRTNPIPQIPCRPPTTHPPPRSRPPSPPRNRRRPPRSPRRVYTRSSITKRRTSRTTAERTTSPYPQCAATGCNAEQKQLAGFRGSER
jgi:hypothetical protein